jgi:hypothetical protein
MGDEGMTVYIQLGATEYDTADYTLPAERTFRDAWETTEDAIIGINMDKARDFWRFRIREAREAEFKKLDAAFMKALESGASTTEIAAEKQQLRDAPAHPDIDAATTPDELKAFQPIPNVTLE